jgi:hypothetical protein
MRHLVILFACMLAVAPAAASAQTIDDIQQRLPGLFGEVETNLVERDAIIARQADWHERFVKLTKRRATLDKRVQTMNAYCNGTFGTEEGARRETDCRRTLAEITELQATLKNDAATLDTEKTRLVLRETDRAAAFDQISDRLARSLGRLERLCGSLSSADFAKSCHLPPAPGPQSAPIVAQFAARLAKAPHQT